ncbi:hypothetical protein Thiowin_00114 [Thiorhodovibrio winogradskyi]|uniref:Methyltransferase FkbM domain-containing protein n=1 Tax=Thiorhodovibrio winogradskyi TaxID=77007 RepID=A0ABZ0S1G7_9GAMM
MPDDLLGIKAVFSPGVNNRKDFEDELLDAYSIASHMCDYSSHPEKFRTSLKLGQTFKKKWLDINGSEDSISLKDWVQELTPDASDDLILQMDIEGAEYRNLLQTPDEILRRFRIIVIELHNIKVCNRPDDFNQELGPLLERLDQYFLCVHAHPNNCSSDFRVIGSEMNLSNVHELTFLRRDRWEGVADVDCYAPMLPHPLDIEPNDPNKPPIFLNEHWLASGKRAPESTIKLLTDQVRFLERALKQAQSPAQDIITNLYRLSQHAASALPTLTPRPTAETLVDLAAGKPFTLSSQHTACPKKGQVAEQRPFFFHTGEGFNQSITIDLGAEATLFELHIANRTKFCQERARCLFYCLHKEPKQNLHQGFPVVIDEAFLTKVDQISVTDLRGARARYVTIFSPEKTLLHLSSVQILGVPNND